MKHWVFSSVLLLIGGALLLAACSGGGRADLAGLTLTAMSVDEAVLDMDADFWAEAPVLEVPTEGVEEGDPPGPTITVQAVYDRNYILIRAEWADPTASVLKDAWTWDGEGFAWGGGEDRLMIHWPIGNNPDFASKGCTALCHNDAEDKDTWWMGSESEDVVYDQWHWKSTRSNPVGQADDKWVGTQEDPSDPESAHHGDERTGGGERRNINEEGTGPAFINGEDLSSPFIFAGQETPIDISLLEAEDVIPAYVLAPSEGSRGDIEALGVWSDGRWVVLLRRALSTGHSDDVMFTPPKSVPFGIAVVDNGGGYDHFVAPDVLTLAWR